MRTFTYVVMLISLLIYQIALPPDFLFNTKPDFLLVFISVMGLVWGVKKGAVYGLLGGILQDLFLGGIPGIYALIKLVLGSLAGLIEGNFYKDRVFIAPIVLFIFTCMHETMVILLSERLLFKINLLESFKGFILPQAILNSLLGLVLYYLVIKVDSPGGSYYE